MIWLEIPGAITSGFMRPSNVGPMLEENALIFSSALMLPTAIGFLALIMMEW